MSQPSAVAIPRQFNVKAAAGLRCPKCDQGQLFRGWFSMHKQCSECGLEFEREQGFYLASIYFNYGAAAIVSASAYTLLAIVYGYSSEIVLAACLVFTIGFPLWFFRYARSVFLAIDYYIHPEGSRARPTAEPNQGAAPDASRVDSLVQTISPEAVLPQRETKTASVPIVQPQPRFSAAELAALQADDATAGMVVSLVVTLAICFGLTLGAIAVGVAMFMPY